MRVAVGVLNVGGVEASQIGTKIFMERGWVSRRERLTSPKPAPAFARS